MVHNSNILKRDIAIGTFFHQLSIGFNKCIYCFFAAFFAYGEWVSVFENIGLIEGFIFVYLFFFYLFLILIFVFCFGVVMALCSSIFKKGVLGTHRFEFNEEEFIESTNYNKSHQQYSAISKVFTRFGSVYITLPGAQCHILPNRDFANKEARESLLKLIKNNGVPAV